ncbi:hypothetical protein ES708_23516 [subsurface metagenome]
MVGIPRWAPIDIEQTWDGNEVTIVLTTDVPCHLWLFWTTSQPWVHRKTRNRRGLSVPWDAYWCFAAWHEIEQEEEGDTYIHTYILPDWQYCETRWFCFRGTVEGELSPSDSPIFSKHFDGRYKKGIIELWTWKGIDIPELTFVHVELWTWLEDDQPSWSRVANEEWS